MGNALLKAVVMRESECTQEHINSAFLYNTIALNVAILTFHHRAEYEGRNTSLSTKVPGLILTKSVAESG